MHNVDYIFNIPHIYIIFHRSSAHGSYQTCEVWSRSNILWLNNNSFYSHGAPNLVFIWINLWESSIKYDTWKWQKWHKIWQENSKQPTSCWVSYFVPGDFFVGNVTVHECTDFHTCTWNVAWGTFRWMCIGGAVEPFCHTYFWNPNQTWIFTSSDACAKFGDFSSMFRPSKMRLSLGNNNNNKQSRFNRVLAPSVLGH